MCALAVRARCKFSLFIRINVCEMLASGKRVNKLVDFLIFTGYMRYWKLFFIRFMTVFFFNEWQLIKYFQDNVVGFNKFAVVIGEYMEYTDS